MESNEELYKELELQLNEILKYQNDFLTISKVVVDLIKTNHNKDLKLCIISILKRALSISEGIKVLIEKKNFSSAAPLSRIYLDNLIRLHAFSLCDDPNKIATRVLSGKKIRELRDSNGKKMFDSYLVDSLAEEYSWITKVYDQTSGYVHFSFQHYLDMIVGKEETEEYKKTIYYMSIDDSHVKIKSWLELTTLIREISKALIKLINSFCKMN